MMEMRYGVLQLNKPVVYVLVGQGQDWKYTELGMLRQRCRGDEISFQRQEGDGKAQIERFVKSVRQAVEAGGAQSNVGCKNSRSRSFRGGSASLQRRQTAVNSYQEEAELAQRRFLKQLSQFADMADSGSGAYPRLVVLDFSDVQPMEAKAVLAAGGKPSLSEYMAKCKMCIRYLCENEQVRGLR